MGWEEGTGNVTGRESLGIRPLRRGGWAMDSSGSVTMQMLQFHRIAITLQSRVIEFSDNVQVLIYRSSKKKALKIRQGVLKFR